MTTHEATARPVKKRDGFIDALRAVALVRVTVWHALGIPVIAWIITTMPLMFFVAGSLLYASLDGKDPKVVLRRRLKRFLVPFWFFGAVVLSTLAIVDLRSTDTATDLSFGRLAAWVFPLINPTGSEWEAGWATSPLWYMRAYLWILLLGPVLMKLWRANRAALLTACVALAFAVQVVADRIDPGPNSLLWILGDLGIYSFFTLLGFAHREGRLNGANNRVLGEWLCIAVLATVVMWRFFPSADGVVNHSYPALLTFGVAWLCAALLCRPALSAVPQIPVLGSALYWMTRRAMSIYLWHSPCIVGAYWLLNALGVAPSAPAVLLIMAILIVVAATSTGWIEDVSAGRRPDIVPLPNGRTIALRSEVSVSRPGRAGVLGAAAAAMTLTLVAAASLAPSGASAAVASASRPIAATSADGLALPPAPSGRPDSGAEVTSQDTQGSGGGLALPPAPSGRPDSGTSATETTEASGGGLGLPPAPSGRPDSGAATSTQVAVANTTGTSIDAIVEQWRVDRGVDGVMVGISSPAGRNMVQAGTIGGGATEITSITKTMTASIVLQLVDEGLLTLDGPLPLIPGVTDTASTQNITVRQLLNHSSGLVPYQSATGYQQTQGLTESDAVIMAANTPLEWTPGSTGGYSNSGFLLLGTLIEHVTGTSFEEQLNARIIGPFGLTSTGLDKTPRMGWVGGAAGGGLSTIPDLLTWGDALYRSNAVLSEQGRTSMLTIDANLDSGLGAFPICPCTTAADGLLVPDWVGHNGGSVSLQYSPADDLVIAVAVTESFWTSELTQFDIHELLRQVRSNL